MSLLDRPVFWISACGTFLLINAAILIEGSGGPLNAFAVVMCAIGIAAWLYARSNA